MFHNCLSPRFLIHNIDLRSYDRANQIGRFHKAENIYYYIRWEICLKCSKMHSFLPRVLRGGGKSTTMKRFKERVKRHLLGML